MDKFSNLSIKKCFFWVLPVLVGFSLNIWSYQKQANIELNKKYRREVAVALSNLPFKGTLKQSRDGYVYLKVPDQYIYRLFPLVQEPGFSVPSSIKRHTKIGAHISVIYKGEAAIIGTIDELGKTYLFEPTRIRHVRAGAKEYIILDVHAPQLEEIRKSHGLSPRLLGHEFHITLAEKQLD